MGIGKLFIYVLKGEKKRVGLIFEIRVVFNRKFNKLEYIIFWLEMVNVWKELSG